jgi:hypothetical protein
MTTLDAGRFPRAAAYLRSLARGLDTHPACQVRDIVVEPYVQKFAALAGEPGLPPPVADMLGGRTRAPWMSEVCFQVAHLVVRDREFADDVAMNEWMEKANAQTFDKPILRNLMRLVSPTLIVLGASKRWSAFHTGSELSTEKVVESGGRAGTTARLRYPARLFSSLFLLTLERSFTVALAASRARDPQVKALSTESELGVSEYAISWRVS